MDPTQEPMNESAAPGSDPEPKGLRDQIAAVRDAAMRLLNAHVNLARTEASEIGAEIGRVALLAGVAFGAVFVVGLLLPIGGMLFLADWLLGSMGWGVLLGVLLLLDIALVAVLVGLGVPGSSIGRDFIVAVLAAGVVTILLLEFIAGPQISAALGLTTLYVAWPILMGLGVARNGVDTDALKARFYPTQTIETTKETIEWVRERTPLGRKS
ncbi:MAG: hypothetical protein EPO00_07650 [Chloroflexota bacterium]|nr:MAG: hypothetical protein EPO00_07650 [Chloroflexota bacterium]